MPLSKTSLIPTERIEIAIYLIRGEKVMLDRDLALLYEVETKMLNRAVKRNLKRFPSDFMFQLTADESDGLRYQIGTSKKGRGGRRYLPYVFTEQGVAMLSSVLNSERALLVNVEIIRAFVKLRQMLASNAEFSRRLDIAGEQNSRQARPYPGYKPGLQRSTNQHDIRGTKTIKRSKYGSPQDDPSHEREWMKP